MKTRPGVFCRASLAEKLLDAERAVGGVRGIIETMELLKIEEIHVQLSGALDDGLDRVERFVRSCQAAIREHRRQSVPAGQTQEPGIRGQEPGSPRRGPKTRKKPA